MKRLLKHSTFFTASSGILLLLAGSVKVVSAFGVARLLQETDPIFSVPFRLLFWIVGSIEILLGIFCISRKSSLLLVRLIAWLATSIAIYRFGLVLVGYNRPCPCLGNLTDTLHIPPQTADAAMKIILAYLLIGSYATLFWLWRQRKKLAQAP